MKVYQLGSVVDLTTTSTVLEIDCNQGVPGKSELYILTTSVGSNVVPTLDFGGDAPFSENAAAKSAHGVIVRNHIFRLSFPKERKLNLTVTWNATQDVGMVQAILVSGIRAVSSTDTSTTVTSGTTHTLSVTPAETYTFMFSGWGVFGPDAFDGDLEPALKQTNILELQDASQVPIRTLFSYSVEPTTGSPVAHTQTSEKNAASVMILASIPTHDPTIEIAQAYMSLPTITPPAQPPAQLRDTFGEIVTLRVRENDDRKRRWSAVIDGVLYFITFHYSKTADAWSVDMETSTEEPLFRGRTLVLGSDFLSDLHHLDVPDGKLVVLDPGKTFIDPGLEGFDQGEYFLTYEAPISG